MLPLFQQNYASSAGIEVFSPVSHTLFNPADIIEKVSEKFGINRVWNFCCKGCYLLASKDAIVFTNWLLLSWMQLMSTKEWGKATTELSILFEACWGTLMGIIPTFSWPFFNSSCWGCWKLWDFTSSNTKGTRICGNGSGTKPSLFQNCSFVFKEFFMKKRISCAEWLDSL